MMLSRYAPSIMLVIVCLSISYGLTSSVHSNLPGYVSNLQFAFPNQTIANTTFSQKTTTEQASSSFTFTQMPLPPISATTSSSSGSGTSSNAGFLPIAAVAAVIAIVLVAIWILRFRKKKEMAKSENTEAS